MGISVQIHKSIDQDQEEKELTLDELLDKYHQKYKTILELKDKSTNPKFHNLINELQDLEEQIHIEIRADLECRSR